ncbi:MAG: hypothetical protein WA836_06225, partial [Candidatus Binataceae bacterium]
MGASEGPKIDDQKSCRNEPIAANSAGSTRSLFFEQLKKIPNEPTEIARYQTIQGAPLPKNPPLCLRVFVADWIDSY